VKIGLLGLVHTADKVDLDSVSFVDVVRIDHISDKINYMVAFVISV